MFYDQRKIKCQDGDKLKVLIRGEVFQRSFTVRLLSALRMNVSVHGRVQVKWPIGNHLVDTVIASGVAKSAIRPELVQRLGLPTMPEEGRRTFLNGRIRTYSKIAYVPLFNGMRELYIPAHVMDLPVGELLLGANALCLMESRIEIGTVAVIEMKALDPVTRRQIAETTSSTTEETKEIITDSSPKTSVLQTSSRSSDESPDPLNVRRSARLAGRVRRSYARRSIRIQNRKKLTMAQHPLVFIPYDVLTSI